MISMSMYRSLNSTFVTSSSCLSCLSIYITNLPSIHEKHVPSVVSQFGLWKGQSASLMHPAVLCLDDTKLVAFLPLLLVRRYRCCYIKMMKIMLSLTVNSHARKFTIYYMFVSLKNRRHPQSKKLVLSTHFL